MTRYIFRGCRRCGGDLYVDFENRRDSDWICLQCGHHPKRSAVLVEPGSFLPLRAAACQTRIHMAGNASAGG